MSHASDHPVQWQIWIPNQWVWSLLLPVSPSLHKPRVGSSDPEEKIPAWKTDSLENDLRDTPTGEFLSVGLSGLEGIFALGKPDSLKNTPAISPTPLPWRWINWAHWSDSPTLGWSDYPSSLSFPVFYFLTWIRFVSWFFLLPSVFLSFIASLELILSKCAWNLRPTLWMVKLLTSNPSLQYGHELKTIKHILNQVSFISLWRLSLERSLILWICVRVAEC